MADGQPAVHGGPPPAGERRGRGSVRPDAPALLPSIGPRDDPFPRLAGRPAAASSPGRPAGSAACRAGRGARKAAPRPEETRTVLGRALRELEREIAARIERRVEQRMREAEPDGEYGFYFRGMDWPVLHPERSREQEEDFEVGRRLGLRIHHPYWDPDLISFLCRVPPRLLLANGREKGLVREVTNRRFPGVGFERQKKVSAITFFRVRLETEVLSSWRELGGVTALGSLGVVDPQLLECSVNTITTSGRLRGLHQLWELMTLEAWVRGRL